MQEIVSGNGTNKDLEFIMNSTIKKVSSDIENMKFNTALAALMTLVNKIYEVGKINKAEYKTLLTLLYPFAPHMTEELWSIVGGEGRLYQAAWPEYEEAKTVESTVEIAVQINGKTKCLMNIAADAAKEDVIAQAKAALGDKLTGNIIKEIYVPGRIVNIVAK